MGTANFDNRSFRLNFEITMVVADRKFNRDVAAMLEDDFRDSRPATVSELRGRSRLHRFAARAAQLTAPIQ